MFDPLGEAMGYIKSGKLRALAVTSATRAEDVADIPAVAELCRATRQTAGGYGCADQYARRDRRKA